MVVVKLWVVVGGGSKTVVGCGWSWLAAQFSNAQTLKQKIQNVENRSCYECQERF